MTASKTGAPLNYTTTIEPIKTAGECVSLLALHGATEISTTWQDGEPIGLKFMIKTAYGPMAYTLPINADGTHKVLLQARNKGKIPARFATEEQADRVAWRVMYVWLGVQLALVEAGVAEFAQVMLPYMHTDGAGSTVWDNFNEHHGQVAIEGPR
jgi:hypothetical protein